MKKNWTFHNIPNLSKKTIIVTGGNSGLGFESVKAFAAKGATVILASRSKKRGDSAKKQILKDFPKAKIDVMVLDLANLASVKSFAKEFKKSHKSLHILLNNAGIMMPPFQLTRDGFESQMGVNHFGHFALTGLLFDILKKTRNSRVVNISSMAHRFDTLDFDNLAYEQGGYHPQKAYGRSKLANLLFTYELARRLKKSKRSMMSVAAHPGISNTNLAHFLEKKFLFKILKPILMPLIAQDASIGALPGIRASTDKNVRNGEYYGPDGYKERKGYPVKVTSNKPSHSAHSAKKLWELSEELTGVKFKF